MQETFKVAQADDLVSWTKGQHLFVVKITSVFHSRTGLEKPTNHTLPKSNMVHLKMDHWNRRFRTWKPSFSGSVLNLE